MPNGLSKPPRRFTQPSVAEVKDVVVAVVMAVAVVAVRAVAVVTVKVAAVASVVATDLPVRPALPSEVIHLHS